MFTLQTFGYDFSYVNVPGCDIFGFPLKPCLSELSCGPLYLPCFLVARCPHRTQEVRCTGARFASGRGRGRGLRVPTNTLEKIRAELFYYFHQCTPNPDSTLRCNVFRASTAGRKLSGVKIRGSYGRRHGLSRPCVGVLFDLLSLVHDPNVQGTRPRTTNLMARHPPHTICTRPCCAAVAACWRQA